MAELSVVVVGGGAFGLPAAVELRSRGHRVTVVDPGPVPPTISASHDASRAVRRDYGGDEPYTTLAGRAIEAWREWNVRTGEELYREVGFLLATREPFEESGFEATSFASLQGVQPGLERLDAAALARRFPMIAPGRFRDAYWNPGAGYARPTRALEVLEREARDAGVEFLLGERVSELLFGDAGVEGICMASGAAVRADHVLVAAGAWTRSLVPGLEDVVVPRAQPLVLFEAEDPAFRSMPVWGADISTEGWYGFPAIEGVGFKVGNHGPGLELDPDSSRDLPPERVEAASEFVADTFPALAGARVLSARWCLYADTPDGEFLIDRHPSFPGLTIAGGGSGHGFKFAPVIGPLIAAVVEGAAPPPSFSWYARDPSRKEAARAR